ncbi:methyl-accepting chemotaxis protein [Sunxiuqinia sp. A32]|uniref:methyl-accepting chemotaxis protein n=1 Tax=Sunxiuqinia sp. A32 TaxID=3461496 RepID=UPI0040465936
MRFVDLKIRTKLYWAFATLIVITLLLGISSLYTMYVFESDVSALTDEYLPVMELASNSSRNTQQLAFSMEGYLTTGKSENYRLAKNNLEELKRTVLEGEELLASTKRMDILEQKLSIARMEIPKYEQVMLMTFKINQDISILRSRLNQNAKVYTENCRAFLQVQNDLLRREVRAGAVSDSRRITIMSISSLIDVGAEVQLMTSEGQLLNNPTIISNALAIFDKIEELLDVITPYTKRSDNINQLKEIREVETDYKSLLSELISKMHELEGYDKQHHELSDKLVANAVELRDEAINSAIETSGGFSKTVVSSISKNVIAILVAIVVAIFTSIFMARIITVPLYKGIEFAKKMAKGDLTVDLDIDQKDEIGELGQNLRQMGEKIRQIITAVTVAADNMASASMELSSTSQHVSQGSSEQASSAEEVSSSIEEMTANIQQNTENAKETEQISNKANTEIQVGQQRVDRTVMAIHEIADKISIIGDIAFQTNILALNAAVEAARAGEHGRGFGVVAAEVGKLAERSKIAALEINELTKSSVFNAEEAGNLMKEIVPEIQKTSRLIQQIAAASLEQSSGADQINSAIQQLNQITQQNAAASEQLATNAVEMSSQAENLQEIVSFFKVMKDDHVSQVKKKRKVVPELKEAEKKVTEQGRGIFIDLEDGDESDEEFERF